MSALIQVTENSALAAKICTARRRDVFSPAEAGDAGRFGNRGRSKGNSCVRGQTCLRSTSVSPSIQPVTPACFTRNEIEARDAAKLEAATDYAALKVANRHGSGEVAAKIQAHVAIAQF